MFEQHEVFELWTRIECQIIVLILSEKVADLLLENPLSLEGLLELVDGILEPLHLLDQSAYLRNEGIHLVVLLKQLSLTNLSADWEVAINTGKVFLKVQLRKQGECLF